MLKHIMDTERIFIKLTLNISNKVISKVSREPSVVERLTYEYEALNMKSSELLDE